MAQMNLFTQSADSTPEPQDIDSTYTPTLIEVRGAPDGSITFQMMPARFRACSVHCKRGDDGVYVLYLQGPAKGGHQHEITELGTAITLASAKRWAMGYALLKEVRAAKRENTYGGFDLRGASEHMIANAETERIRRKRRVDDAQAVLKTWKRSNRKTYELVHTALALNPEL